MEICTIYRKFIEVSKKGTISISPERAMLMQIALCTVFVYVCVFRVPCTVTLQRPKSEFLGTHEPLFVILFVKKTQTIFKMLTHADTHRYASCRSHRFLLYQNEYSYFSENPCKRNYFQIPFYGNDYGRHLLSQ